MALISSYKAPKLASKLDLGLGIEEDLRRRNEELEREVREREEREEAMRREMEAMRERLRFVEEAEERLCAQLGDLEAEALTQARASRRRIQDLLAQLSEAKRCLASRTHLVAR